MWGCVERQGEMSELGVKHSMATDVRKEKKERCMRGRRKISMIGRARWQCVDPGAVIGVVFVASSYDT